MSALLYPSTAILPGQSIEVMRSYVWKSFIQEALSGKMSALGGRVYPLVHYELSYNVLRDVGAPGYGAVTTSEIRTIAGLHNQMQGRVDTFLFTDPDFNTIPGTVLSQFATGDGSTLGPFQLTALYQNTGGPGSAELIQNLNGTPNIYVNGIAQAGANYSISATGAVTFTAGHAPGAGLPVQWNGSWYYRCRFDDDAIVYKRFMNKLWSADVKFTSVKL